MSKTRLAALDRLAPTLNDQPRWLHWRGRAVKVDEAGVAGITEQVKAGVFPVRLEAGDWLSGEHVWLLDVIAGDARAATSVLANFRQLAGERVVKIHPMVGRLIEPEALERLRGGGKGAGEAEAAKASAFPPTEGSA